MAANSQNAQKTYEIKVLHRAIQHLFTKATSDVVFIFPADGNDPNQQRRGMQAHKTLLSAVSPVFQAMFSGVWASSARIEISDATCETFNALINYIYTEEVTITSGNVVEMLHLAEKYEIKELIPACTSFLEEHDKINYSILASTPVVHDRMPVRVEFMRKNTHKVIDAKEFSHCHKIVLHTLLSIDESTVPEERLFDKCMEWATNKCHEQNIDATNAENLRHMLGDCFHLIRFKEMEREELSNRLQMYKDMFSKEEIIEFCTQAGNQHAGKRFKAVAPIQTKRPRIDELIAECCER